MSKRKPSEHSKGSERSDSISEASQSTKIWTPSNIITLFRICLVPVFVVALVSPWPEWLGIHDLIDNRVRAWISAGIFIVISSTDWVDGYLARRRGEVTDLGKFLDPLADKILVAAALIALVELDYLPAWPALIILTREFIVSGIRMVAASKGFVIAASWYGKVKTVLQIIAIVLFIVKGGSDLNDLGSVALYVIAWAVMIAALVMTVISMLDYIAKARPLLFPKDKSTESSTAEFVEFEFEKEGINDLAKRVVELANDRGVTLGCAESLTGGLIAASITAVPGSSAIFKGACVTYVNEVKHKLLGVDKHLLADQGAVNETCALQMAQGAASELDAQIVISVTGIAGPSGAERGKPVGTVYMGIYAFSDCRVEHFEFSGDRTSVREATVAQALSAFLGELR